MERVERNERATIAIAIAIEVERVKIKMNSPYVSLLPFPLSPPLRLITLTDHYAYTHTPSPPFFRLRIGTPPYSTPLNHGAYIHSITGTAPSSAKNQTTVPLTQTKLRLRSSSPSMPTRMITTTRWRTPSPHHPSRRV